MNGCAGASSFGVIEYTTWGKASAPDIR